MRSLPLQSSLIWQSYLLVAIFGTFAPIWPLPASCCLALLVWLDSRLWQWVRLVICLLIFLVIAGFAQTRFQSATFAITHPPPWVDSSQVRICAKVISVQGIPDNRLRLLLTNATPTTGAPLPGNCLWTWEHPQAEPLPGQTVCITRQPRPIGGFANYSAQSYDKSLFAQKIYWRIFSRKHDGNPRISGEPYPLAKLRQELKAHLLTLFGQPTQGQAVLLALLFGDRSLLEPQTITVFSRAAIAHSLALSGQHLAIAGVLGWLVIALCSRVWPAMLLLAPRAQWIFGVSLVFALFYLWLGNAPQSLMRAAFMLLVAGLMLWRHRLFTGMDILAAALLLILLLHPLAALDLGLQLSALSVATILIIWPAFTRIRPSSAKCKLTLRKRIFSSFVKIFFISLAIQIVLMPIAITRFHQAGLYFPVNLFWLPVLAVWILPLGVLGLMLSFLSAPLANSLLALAAWPCDLLIHWLKLAQESGLLQEPALLAPPWTALPAGIIAFCGAACLLTIPPHWTKVRKLLLTGLALLACGPAMRLYNCLDNKIRIEALDAGQGQAILLTLPGQLKLLLDGSGSYSNRFDPGEAIVGPYLCDNAPPQLTAVVNSHPDLDHLGGLFYILKTFRTDYIFHNGRPAQKGRAASWNEIQQKQNALALSEGDLIILGKPENEVVLEVLHPPARTPELQGNAASLVLRLRRRGVGLAIFPGDADKVGLRQILKQKQNPEALVVFAPHHGSDKNLLAAFYQHTKPELVIACCGYLNRWHYPGKKLRAWLVKNGIPLMDTGRLGRITVAISAENTLQVEKVK